MSIGLIVIGFVTGPILLIIILPLIVDSNILEDDEESTRSSTRSQTKGRNSDVELDEGNTDEEFEEIASF